MSKPLSGRIVIATHNAGKLDEFRKLLSFYPGEIVSAGQLGLASPAETGTSFVENSILKAKAASLATGSIALADDSGLCVTALGDRPGLYSARWAENGSFVPAMQRIQNELGDATDRSASFICVLSLYWPDGSSDFVEGRVYGTLAKTPRGIQGHGYDPIFIPQGETRTFAEMSGEEKNNISHRGKATKALIDKFFTHAKGA